LLNVLLKGCVALSKAGDKMFRLSCMHPNDDDESQLVNTVFLFKTKTVQVFCNWNVHFANITVECDNLGG
jgi:hypothetical protein